MKELFSFHYAFQLSRMIVFEVNYYRLGNNKNKRFATSAEQFNRPKTDYNQCGQAQKDLLKGFTTAMNFYEKWDHLHINDLTEKQHTEMLADIELLKAKYNYDEKMHSENRFRFWEIKNLSMQTVKKASKKPTKTNVIISHFTEDEFNVTEEDTVLPLATFKSHEEAEQYCNENNLEIVACID